jgi:hypothetical protein
LKRFSLIERRIANAENILTRAEEILASVFYRAGEKNGENPPSREARKVFPTQIRGKTPPRLLRFSFPSIVLDNLLKIQYFESSRIFFAREKFLAVEVF